MGVANEIANNKYIDAGAKIALREGDEKLLY